MEVMVADSYWVAFQIRETSGDIRRTWDMGGFGSSRVFGGLKSPGGCSLVEGAQGEGAK